ncbi:MAG: segregation/condensation protein A [Sphaerochaetaceae bacterium]|nr:segregation/condensation protein A [Sphaerochaetaceae bacterium]
MFEFSTPAYNGPLDLLLALIQKNEVNIYDIPIAMITEQFLEYIHKAGEIGIQDLSDFYKMAAELIYIKSQMLIPKDLEFDEEYLDPRSELVERLLEYSKFRKYSELLLGNETQDDFVIERKPTEFILPFDDSDLWGDSTVQDLLDTYIRLFSSVQSVSEKVFNVYEEVSDKEKIALMNELLEKQDSIMFTDLFKDKRTPMHIICAFLAVLEAVKDKMVLVDQPVLFGDMTITRRPEDWNPNLADSYDSTYDEMESKKYRVEPDNFSVMDDENVSSEEHVSEKQKEIITDDLE